MTNSEIDTKKIVEFDGTKESYGIFAFKFYALCKVKQLAHVLSSKFMPVCIFMLSMCFFLRRSWPFSTMKRGL